MTDRELAKRLAVLRDGLADLHLRDRAWFVSKSERRKLKKRRATKREAKRAAKGAAHRAMWRPA